MGSVETQRAQWMSAQKRLDQLLASITPAASKTSEKGQENVSRQIFFEHQQQQREQQDISTTSASARDLGAGRITRGGGGGGGGFLTTSRSGEERFEKTRSSLLLEKREKEKEKEQQQHGDDGSGESGVLGLEELAPPVRINKLGGGNLRRDVFNEEERKRRNNNNNNSSRGSVLQFRYEDDDDDADDSFAAAAARRGTRKFDLGRERTKKTERKDVEDDDNGDDDDDRRSTSASTISLATTGFSQRGTLLPQENSNLSFEKTKPKVTAATPSEIAHIQSVIQKETSERRKSNDDTLRLFQFPTRSDSASRQRRKEEEEPNNINTTMTSNQSEEDQQHLYRTTDRLKHQSFVKVRDILREEQSRSEQLSQKLDESRQQVRQLQASLNQQTTLSRAKESELEKAMLRIEYLEQQKNDNNNNNRRRSSSNDDDDVDYANGVSVAAIQKTVAALQMEIEAGREELAASHLALTEERRQYADLQLSLSTALQENASLLVALENERRLREQAADKEREHVDEKISTIERRAHAQNKRAATAEMDLERAEEKLIEKIKEVETLRDRLNEVEHYHEEDVQKLRMIAEKWQERAQNAESELDERRVLEEQTASHREGRIERMMEEMRRAKDSMEVLENEKHNLSVKLEKMQRERESMEKTLREFQVEVSQLREEHRKRTENEVRLERRIEEGERREKELKIQIETEKRDMVVVREKLQQLQWELDTDSSSSEIQRLQSALNREKHQVALLTKDVGRESEKVAHLEETIRGLELSLQTAQAAASSARDEGTRALQTTAEEVDALLRARDNFAQRCKSLEASLSESQLQLEHYRIEYESLQNQVAIRHKTVERLEVRAVDAETKLARAHQQIQVLQDQVSASDAEIESLLGKMKENLLRQDPSVGILSAECESLRNRLSATENERNELHSRLSKSEYEVNNLIASIENLERQLEEEDKRKRNSEEAVERMRIDLERKREESERKRSHAERERDEIARQIEELEEAKQEVERKNSDCERRREEAEKKRREAERTLGEKEKKLQESHQQILDLEKKLSSVSLLRDELVRQLKTSSEMGPDPEVMEAARERIDALKTQVEKLQRNLDSERAKVLRNETDQSSAMSMLQRENERLHKEISTIRTENMKAISAMRIDHTADLKALEEHLFEVQQQLEQSEGVRLADGQVLQQLRGQVEVFKSDALAVRERMEFVRREYEEKVEMLQHELSLRRSPETTRQATSSSKSPWREEPRVRWAMKTPAKNNDTSARRGGESQQRTSPPPPPPPTFTPPPIPTESIVAASSGQLPIPPPPVYSPPLMPGRSTTRVSTASAAAVSLATSISHQQRGNQNQNQINNNTFNNNNNISLSPIRPLGVHLPSPNDKSPIPASPNALLAALDARRQRMEKLQSEVAKLCVSSPPR